MNAPHSPLERFEKMQDAVAEAYREEGEAMLPIIAAGGVLQAPREVADRWIRAAEQYAQCVRDLLDARDAYHASVVPVDPATVARRERAWAEVQ